LVGAFAVIAYGDTLRGNEVFHTDLHGLLKYNLSHLEEVNHCYVLIPLLGRFKNEDGEQYHPMPLAFEMASGLNIGLWVEWLITLKKSQLHNRGPAFIDKHGRRLSSHWVEMGNFGSATPHTI
jgi:hypothetical protein